MNTKLSVVQVRLGHRTTPGVCACVQKCVGEKQRVEGGVLVRGAYTTEATDTFPAKVSAVLNG